MGRKILSIKPYLLMVFVPVYICLFSTPLPAIDYYVDKTFGSDTNPGTSWLLAKATIRDALTVAGGDDVIHVAAENYIGGNLFLKENITLLGGYPPGGGARDPATNETSIDISRGVGSCVIGADNAVVDGFTLIRGTGRSVGPDLCGGGVLCENTSPIIRNNVIITNNAWNGGGIYCSNSAALIINNTFIQNDGIGGAIFLTNSEATVEGNMFIQNSGGFYGGGAICCEDSTASLIANNFFIRNNGGSSFSPVGGAIYCRTNAFPTIINNTFVDNSAPFRGGAIFCQTGSTPVIRNNIFYDNSGDGIIATSDSSYPVVDYNVFWINGGDVYTDDSARYPTVSVMDASLPNCSNNSECDPRFVNPKMDDYHLLPGSCCIDSGSAVNAPAMDYDDDMRPLGSGFDIGADEYAEPLVPAGKNCIWILVFTIPALLVKTVLCTSVSK